MQVADTSDVNSYQSDPRTPCKYGAKCYQKNPQHHNKFKHPPAPVLPTTKVKISGGSTEKRKSEEELSSDQDLPATKRCRRESTEDSSRSPSPHISPVHSPSKNDADCNGHTKKQTNKTELVKPTQSVSAKTEFAEPAYMSTDEPELPDGPEDVHESIKQKFLVDMPDDFYHFWEFCKNLNPKDLQAPLSPCGLVLVGAFDVVAGRTFPRPHNLSRFLCHYRYYHDPPEMQTVLCSVGDGSGSRGGVGGFRIGYFRDSPDEAPVFLASMSDAKPGVVTPLGDNIFDAVRAYCLEAEKTAGPFKKPQLSRLAQQLRDAAHHHNHGIDTKADTVKRRKKRVVCRSFHGAGVVVPFDKKTEVGYREIPETDANLRRMLAKVAMAVTEGDRAKRFADVQELITNAQFATDEGDFGMGLELGLALFLNGSIYFYRSAEHLLTVAYSLLGRDAFATITKAHLKNRREGSQMSAFDFS